MKKLKSSSGLTLIEMMVALFILVMMIVGMDTVMDSSMRVYNDATFEADSSVMANIVNTAMGDVLRYADSVELSDGTPFEDASGTPIPDKVGFVFTNYEYGIRRGFFCMEDGILKMQDIAGGEKIELVNQGAYRAKSTLYNHLVISNFRIAYVQPGAKVTNVTVELSPGDFDDVIMDAGQNIETNASGAGDNGYTSRGGYFAITYTISDETDATRFRNESYIVRLMNVPNP